MFIILVIICLVRITLLKEILIAASELNMTNGEFAFVGFELDLYAAWNRQYGLHLIFLLGFLVSMNHIFFILCNFMFSEEVSPPLELDEGKEKL